MDYSDKFKDILNSNETIIKIYKPNKFKYWLGKVIGLILLLCLFLFADAAISNIEKEGTTVSEFSIKTFTILSLISVCIVILILLYWIFFYRNIFYCISTERVIIRRGVFGTDYRALEMQMIGVTNVNVSLLDKIAGKNTGSITFASNAAPIGYQASMFVFEDIVDPYQESKEIKTAIDNCKARAVSREYKEAENKQKETDDNKQKESNDDKEKESDDNKE